MLSPLSAACPQPHGHNACPQPHGHIMSRACGITVAFIILSSQLATAVSANRHGYTNLRPKWTYQSKPPRTAPDTLRTAPDTLRTAPDKLRTAPDKLWTAPDKNKFERNHLNKVPEAVSKMIEKYSQKNDKKDELLYDTSDDYWTTTLKASTHKASTYKARTHKASAHKAITHKSSAHKAITPKASSHKVKRGKLRANYNLRVTKLTRNAKKKDLYVQPYQVKQDRQITEFTKYIYKQSLKVFDSIKEKTTNEKIKKELDFLAQSYEDKFGDFVRETQEQQIKTRIGRQKVIINTLQTSNRILKRLFNYVIGKMDKNSLRNEVADNVFQKEINKKIVIENNHICKKFGICKSQDGFSSFVVDIMGIVLSAGDSKVKQVSGALTEALKYIDFSHSKIPTTEQKINKLIYTIDNSPGGIIRSILTIIKNLLLNRNKPIEVVGEYDERVNRTIAFLEMVDAMETALPANEENRLVWADLQSSLGGWKDARRMDITEIAQSFVDHFKKGTQSFDYDTAFNFERNFNMMVQGII